MIISDANLQGLLREGNLYANLDMQSRMEREMHHLMQTFPIIDSIFILPVRPWFLLWIAVHGVHESANVEHAPWYDEAVTKQGLYLVAFKRQRRLCQSKQKEDFVSFHPHDSDMDDTTPLGILVINIPESAFADACSNLANHNGQQFAILDEQHRLITSNAARRQPVRVIDHLAKEVLS